MLKSKEFWIGFLIAYALVSFMPSVGFSRLAGRRKSS